MSTEHVWHSDVWTQHVADVFMHNDIYTFVGLSVLSTGWIQPSLLESCIQSFLGEVIVEG